ncbi:hypothetical protein T459_32721 [Capsicum annuum]|uniref:DNA-directed RNA polymerase n=1 Tax=Capsicum annuum TaxID=4072 RepID=A0A2G2Y0S7_CAPAN|nr:hypothetical protein T459_32721 [Capsicum annuum]
MSDETDSLSRGIDKQYLASPIKNPVDKYQLIPEFLKVRGLVKQHLDSFNYFVKTEINKIVRANNEIRSTRDPSIYLRYRDVRIGEPSMIYDGVTEKLSPQKCRLSSLTYAAPIYVTVDYTSTMRGKKQESTEKDVVIGRMPIMLRSCSCVLYGKDEEQLAKLGECPLDPGGYFVVNGTEKAMGMESDQEVVQMLGRDPRFSALLLPSIEECANLKVYTQHQALEFLESDKMLNVFSYFSGPVEKGARALSILRDILLANVPVHQHNFRKKCIYVAVMMRRMMEAILNKDTMDDKDYVGNKRLELSGQILSLLFEDLFKTMNAESKREFDASPSARYILYCIKKYNRITSELGRTLSTGNWDVKRFGMHKKGVTDVVARLSYIGTLGNMTKIKPQFEKSRKVSGPRALQPSQFGMLCPCDTPEGEACGLVKNLALMTHVTTDEDERPIISLCYYLGVEDLELLSAEELHVPSSYLIVLNGLMLGKHKSLQRFANAMRKLRRAGKIGEFVSIFVNKKQRCVYIASDGGRVCRPLVIADKGVSRIKELHMKELRDGVCDFNSFLKDGLIEYLDVNEENSLIALYEKEATPETTHIEIEPFTILGVCASLIPYPHHNQSPRNTYQCAMGSGQNATVAVMSYSGYDIEDAIVMNKSSLDRGFGRCIVMKKYTAICQKYDSCTSDRIIKPQRQGYEADRMQILDDDEIAAPGEIIRRHDIYINKESPIVTRWIPGTSPTVLPDTAYKPSRQTYQGTEGELAVVDRVALHSDENNNLSIKFMIRDTRRPEIGDKFSSRHGQKGVCGTIVQ